MGKKEIANLLKNNKGFLELKEGMTSRDWQNEVSYFLSKIRPHELELGHTVKEYAIMETDFKKNKKEYRKIWICSDCGMIFLKTKYDPEVLKIKEFYQMCFCGGLSDLATREFKHQLTLNNK